MADRRRTPVPGDGPLARVPPALVTWHRLSGPERIVRLVVLLVVVAIAFERLA